MPNYRRGQDHFGRRAKKEGRAARSIYKLQEIDRRWHVLQRGATVVDLGCAPGSWLQYASERVTSAGRVFGIDLKPVEVALASHVTTIVGDAFDLSAHELPELDTLLSDMAPATMGDHATDAARSAGLVERALDVADAKLKPGGSVVLKILEGRDLQEIVKRMRATFEKVEQLRPEATRKRSTEIFLVGLRRKRP